MDIVFSVCLVGAGKYILSFFICRLVLHTKSLLSKHVGRLYGNENESTAFAQVSLSTATFTSTENLFQNFKRKNILPR